MTDTELNAKAAKICGLRNITVCEGNVYHILEGGSWEVPFMPTTNPADCAVLMEVMDSRGWLLDLDRDDARRFWFCQYIHMSFEDGPEVHCSTWPRAVTEAAVRAGEGST